MKNYNKKTIIISVFVLSVLLTIFTLVNCEQDSIDPSEVGETKISIAEQKIQKFLKMN